MADNDDQRPREEVARQEEAADHSEGGSARIEKREGPGKKETYGEEPGDAETSRDEPGRKETYGHGRRNHE